MSRADNVRNILDLATVTEQVEGANWYHGAQRIADELGGDRGAGVLAAMSPLMSWPKCVELARRMVRTGIWAGGLPRNCDKARRIWQGAEPLTVLRGHKVRAFYRGIMGDADAVVIDRHAFDIVLGRVTDDATRRRLGLAGQYERFAAPYRTVARERGLAACDVQAITWLTWRRLKDSAGLRGVRA